MNSRIQRSWRQVRDVTVIRNFQGESINKYMRGPSQLSAPINSQPALRIYATKKGLNGGRQNWLRPQAWETLGTPLIGT